MACIPATLPPPALPRDAERSAKRAPTAKREGNPTATLLGAPVERLFGGRRQRTTGLKVSIADQASLSTAAAYAAPAWLAALLWHRVPPALEHRDGFAFAATPDASRRRDYRCTENQPSMERRCSALPPWSPFRYHGSFLNRARCDWVPPPVHDCRACQFQASVMHRLPASRIRLMSPQRLASRASNYRAVCSERSPRTTTGPFAAEATTGSATMACIPATPLTAGIF